MSELSTIAIDRRRFIQLGGAMALHATCVRAEDAGASPIRLVVPFGAGTYSDLVGRAVAEALAAEIKQTVIVENRAGALGTIGSGVVARAPGDGRTLLLGTSGTHAAAPFLLKSMPYQPLADFQPVAMIGIVPYVLILRRDFPATDVASLLVAARATPGRITVGQSSSTSRVLNKLLGTLGQVDLHEIAYKTSQQSAIDLMAQRIDLLFVDLPQATALLQNQGLKAIAVTSAQRSPFMPQVPTLAETLATFDVVAWTGLFVPRATPAKVVDALADATRRLTQTPAFRTQMTTLNTQASVLTTADFRRRLERETLTWKAHIQAAGIEPE